MDHKNHKRDDDSNENIVGERLRPGVHTKTIGIKVLYFSDECNACTRSAINYWNHQPTSSHIIIIHSLTHSLTHFTSYSPPPLSLQYRTPNNESNSPYTITCTGSCPRRPRIHSLTHSLTRCDYIINYHRRHQHQHQHQHQ